MAFDRSKLHPLAATSPKLWMYEAPSGDAAANMKTADYFLTAADELVVGDVILATDANNGTAQMLQVDANTGTGGTVTTVYLTNA